MKIGSKFTKNNDKYANFQPIFPMFFHPHLRAHSPFQRGAAVAPALLAQYNRLCFCLTPLMGSSGRLRWAKGLTIEMAGFNKKKPPTDDEIKGVIKYVIYFIENYITI